MRYLVFLLLILVPMLGVWTFVTADQYGWWLPENVSSYGGAIDTLFYVIAVMIVITFLGTEVVLAWAAFKFSAPKLQDKGQFTHGSHKLEMIWTAIPAVLLLVIAFTQMSTWAAIKFDANFPDGETGEGYSIENPFAEVWASQFDWRVRYPDAAGDLYGVDAFEKPYDLVVPVDTDIVFHLRSRDVLHSFFVPAFRLKQDAVPGMTIPVWFRAEKVGEYDLICAELCGWGHYKMAGRVKVLAQDEFDAWLEAERGSEVPGSLYHDGSME